MDNHFKLKDMTTLDSLKNNLISHIMASKNEKFLKAISNIFDSTREDNIVSPNPHQIEVLMVSERDIENGNFVKY